jgi:biopolymer transport protein ExbB/TolQ
MRKLWKILVIGGGVLFILGLVGTPAGIYMSFDSLRANESAGIGAVGDGLGLALIGSIVSIIGLLLLIAGAIMLALKKNDRDTYK